MFAILETCVIKSDTNYHKCLNLLKLNTNHLKILFEFFLLPTYSKYKYHGAISSALIVFLLRFSSDLRFMQVIAANESLRTAGQATYSLFSRCHWATILCAELFCGCKILGTGCALLFGPRAFR